MSFTAWTGAGVAVVAATTLMGLTATPAIAAPGDAPSPRASRAVTVELHNDTGCTLRKPSKELYHGIWTQEPASIIPKGQSRTMRTESDGFMTGTEAAVSYEATNCVLAGKKVRFHWNNPYYGRNSYDFDYTDPTFAGRWEGGNGDNATVDVYFSTRG